MSNNLVFPVDQQLCANEGRWPYNNLTNTRYCSLGTRWISYTNTRPTLNLPLYTLGGVSLRFKGIGVDR